MTEQTVESPIFPAETAKSKSLFGDSELTSRPQVDAAAMEEFAYRPVPPLAPISMFLGICALAGFLGVPALAIGIVGVVCGLLAIWQIRRSEGTLGGGLIARIGLGLSLALTVAAGAFHAYTYVTEVPEGHQRITFSWLSKQEMAMQGNDILLPPAVIEMDKKPIFIKGYMYPSRQREGIKEFVLVKDTGDCCFGKQPKLTDMIVVHMKDGQRVSFREQQLVSVAGVFHIVGLHQSGDVMGLYSMDGTHFR